MDDPRRNEAELPQSLPSHGGDTEDPSSDEALNHSGWLMAQEDEESSFVRAYN